MVGLTGYFCEPLVGTELYRARAGLGAGLGHVRGLPELTSAYSSAPAPAYGAGKHY